MPEPEKRPAPEGWFDLSPEAYADLGAMVYLSALTATHRNRSLLQAVNAFETPLRLKQYKIFRQNGFPRAFVTYAGLSPEVERRFAIDHAPILGEDYASGPSFWIVDLVSPFGQIRQIAEIMRRTIPFDRMRANRLDSDMSRPRIVEWTRDKAGAVHMRLYRKAEFAALLDGGAG
ncbi:Hemolysin-activating lysine-acyltransferase HlyC [Pseudoruegeria aquimaris]|uniref:RTX toxin-activating lysine-acyltransferase n=2 Tax=Pseudoruegeria aquimaris TaxID=393663 RepID=A0A1Y5RGY6_9RHOB|nr:Hemolysin-activating lysine-acyltransferase HlyC [Pseudoruegeria aquimaris]